MFENFPYTNFHDLNLDWIIQKLKEAQQAIETAYTPTNPPPYPVTSVNGETGAVNLDFPVDSVNGMTGDVHLYAVHDGVYIRFPDGSGDTWNIYRLLDGTHAGIQFDKDGPMQRISGTHRYDVYDENNQPPYPVASVNGQTGAVVLYTVVDSATGTHIQLPDELEKSGWSIRRMVEDNTQTGIQVNKTGPLQRIQGEYMYTVYDSANQPPYPVTSVNGETGAVVTPFAVYSAATNILSLKVPATEAEYWGIKRAVGDEIDNITLEFRLEHTNTVPEMYIKYDDGQDTVQRKLLTIDDIPSSSGVVSVNGESGVVTLNGTNLYYNANTTLNSKIDSKQDTLTFDSAPMTPSTNPVTSQGIYTALENKQDTLTFDSTPTDPSTNPVTSQGIKRAIDSKEENVNGNLAYIENGATAFNNISAGEFLYRNGDLYKAIAAITAGDPFSASNIEAVTIGGLNELNNNIATLNSNIATRTKIVFADYEASAGSISYTFTENGMYLLVGSPYDEPDTGVIMYLLNPATAAVYTAKHAIKTGSETTVTVNGLTVTISSTQAYMQYSIIKLS